MEKQVEELLSQNEALRNDDLALTIAYWERYDGVAIKNPPTKATSPASIIRARARLQAKGKYPPTDPLVRERRRKRQLEVRTWVAEAD